VCATFRDASGVPIDQGIALYFEGPASYTGEDVLELHGHGGPVVLDCLLARTLELGARPARPGEFSERAFLNGKLDLVQAEAVAALIESGSTAAARGAMRALTGEFSRRMESLTSDIMLVRAYVEGSLDFPGEELELLSDAAIADRLTRLVTDVE